MTELDLHPVTRDRWDDLVKVFGDSGAYSGCWCMWFRETSREFDAHHGDDNRDRLRELAEGGREPGLVAYAAGQPIGWVSVAPRTEFGRVLRSPLFAPRLRAEPDADEDVWSVVCSYVARPHRGKGILHRLIAGARDHAATRGARAVEGYPIVLAKRARAADLYVGTVSAFRAAGFAEVAQPSPARRIMRWQP